MNRRGSYITQRTSKIMDRSAQDRFIKSSAGYCVITFILGIGDRHLDNLMVKSTGELFHIDFGFLFGRDPKPWPSPMRLTKEMVEALGGRDGEGFKRFKATCWDAYRVLRANAPLLLNLLSLMVDANIPDMSIHQDAGFVLEKVQEKFMLGSDEEAGRYLDRLIDESLNATMPVIMDYFHGVAVSMK